jgi:hypothetical protein
MRCHGYMLSKILYKVTCIPVKNVQKIRWILIFRHGFPGYLSNFSKYSFIDIYHTSHFYITFVLQEQQIRC